MPGLCCVCRCSSGFRLADQSRQRISKKPQNVGFLQLSESMIQYLELKKYMGCVRERTLSLVLEDTFSVSLSNSLSV